MLEKMTDDVAIASQRLIDAIEIIMNPVSNQRQRAEASKLCEDFKENSPVCAQCGLHLSSVKFSPIVRHVGLQLIEHCIKFRWNNMSVDEKNFIKSNSMQLLASGTENIMSEQAHIKDALSRIIVEMIKREWPQQWPTLLKELNDLCFIGVTQMELVLRIFWRLAEDIVAFQNVQYQRRREIYQALTSNLREIFTFFLTSLKDHSTQYRQMKNSTKECEKDEADVHCRVAETALLTLTGFVEWVPITHITADNSLLLQVLCLLLDDSELQFYAAECLLLIVGRKGKIEERKPLLMLFSEDAMSYIFSAASSAAVAPLNERHYVFLKKLCQLLTGLGGQLCALWGTTEGDLPPATFATYLNSILAFTRHPSQTLSSYTQSLWVMFFRHEHASQDRVLQSVISDVADTAMDKLIKAGLPSRSDFPSCDYSRLDFDSDEDFNAFFGRFRAEVIETLRYATILCPTVTFSFAAQWLRTQLVKPIDFGTVSENGLCNLSSPSYLQWDGLASYLESVMSRMFSNEKPKPSAEEGIELLKLVLSYETQDPLILSCVLSCISALFVFLTIAPETLPVVLKKIFSSVIFSLPGQTKATRSRAVKNVRRHACSSLVKICKQHPKLLLPSFDQIYSHVKNLSCDPEQLSQMEKCTLLEALVLISNEFHNYNQQTSFIQEILVPVSTIWLSPELKSAFENANTFMAHIGLDRAPVEPSSQDTGGINRSQIVYCVNTIWGIIKRSKWPEDPEVAKKGGFLCPSSSGTSSLYFRNPTTLNIAPLIERLFSLIRVLNASWIPDARAKVHPYFSSAHDMLEADKNNILGLNSPSLDLMDSPTFKQPLERMKHFLSTIHDNCYYILGSSAQSLGCEFFSIPDLTKAILNSVFTDMEHLPDYRLRPVIRVFIKPFAQFCPPEYHTTTIIPVLQVLCPLMYQKLSLRWQNFKQRYGTSVGYEDEMTETQEVLEDQLNRQLTREYIDLLGIILHNRRGEQNPDAMEEENEQRPSTQSENLTELGVKVLRTETICPYVVMTIFSAVHWLDSVACLKSIQLCWLVLKQLLADNLICKEEEAVFLLQSVLLGLQELGEHDGNQALLIGLGLQTYEALRQLFPSITSVMLQVPGCKVQDLQAFDEKIMQSTPSKQVPEKRKKDLFKKLVSEIIGQNIGQYFKRDIFIKNLPPLFRRPKPKPPSVDELEEHDVGLCSLFDSNKEPSSSL